jgi:hypothetical protein
MENLTFPSESEIWYEEMLEPQATSIDDLIEGVKDYRIRESLSGLQGKIRIHIPRWKLIEKTDDQSFSQVGKHYYMIRLGCEFDPGRRSSMQFVEAKFSVFIWGENNNHPRVHLLAPLELNEGGSRIVSLKLGPSITFPSQTSLSIGEIGTNLEIGQIAPVVRGFAGEFERQPYWVLKGHRNAPLYGLRHFWLIVETANNSLDFYISTRVEVYIQTKLGRLLLRPKKQDFTSRPRFTISGFDISSADR